MLYRVILLMLLLLALFPVLVLAEEDPGLQPPPWHLIDIWWDIGKDAPFESYSIDATISDDVPPTVNLYVANRHCRVERDEVLRRHPDSGRWLHQAGSKPTADRPRLPDVDVGPAEPRCDSAFGGGPVAKFWS